jgi:molybdate transport system ATP-binding protein
MPTDQSQNPAGGSLEVRIRKLLRSSERDFSLDVDFRAAPGFTILFGPSGAGKTTLLDCVAGLATPDAGRIAAAGQVFFDTPGRTNVACAKRGVGYVFQDLALFPHLSVEENAAYGIVHLSRSQRTQRVQELLREFRIDALRHRMPGKISGGERQRAALARTLVTDPCVLLLDEPLAALDAATKAKILDDLRRWNRAHRIPILYVTHSREEVLALGDQVMVVDNGRVIAQGAPHEVLRAPAQQIVAQLSGFENIFDAAVESASEDRGTMCCRLLEGESGGVVLETPLVRAEVGSRLRIGIRAGDILLATAPPVGLSARNVIAGTILALERRDLTIVARVHCGVEMAVYLTLAARDGLRLEAGQVVWLVIKTHSCHLMLS